MLIKVGYDIGFGATVPTPMITMLNIHPSRRADIVGVERVTSSPLTPISFYTDGYGNTCGRLVVPAGGVELNCRAIVRDSGKPDAIAPNAVQHRIEDLPDECLMYLIGSRYCETDRLVDLAWSLFKDTAPGWARVQAICDYVRNRIEFGYPHAKATRSAYGAHEERQGVCRDFAHLAVTLCRCMNIPARYCAGYLGDIGVPKDLAPMDFSAWFEVYLGNRWHTFDARHNTPRIGRIVIARGRDAADVPISNSFGATTLTRFDIVTDEVEEQRTAVQQPATRLKQAV
jgi:transglutaminase-like putative cysteine protease